MASKRKGAKLKPCPKCGSCWPELVTRGTHLEDGPNYAYSVECTCGKAISGRDKADAIYNWNRRTTRAKAR